ncbi:MAG: sulfatase-like hydrolase/transferase [Chloroflexi bacterium]|nr:sulfatase-like hydrolase/transferase [Chloroflexota bacterium]
MFYRIKNSAFWPRNTLGTQTETTVIPNRWRKILADRPFIASIIFALTIFIFEEFRFDFPHTYYMLYLPREPYIYFIGGMVSVVLSFLVLILILWASFNSKAAYRLIFGAIFIFAILVQYNYKATFNRFISIQDLNTAFNSPFSLWLDAAALFFNWFGLFPIITYLLLMMWTWRHQYQGGKLLLAVILIIFGLNLGSYYVGYGASRATSVPAFLKTLSNVFVEDVEVQNLERTLVTYQSETQPQNNIILIVDESIRGDRLSLNGYERSTTPYLEELAAQGYLINWGIAASATTCSMLSNEFILSGGTILPDLENRLKTNPTIFQYAKAMGYTTYHIDAQVDYLWTGITSADLTYIDHRVTRQAFGDDYDVDLRVADFIYETLATSTGNFFLINKAGVHFHYNDTYPPDEAIWKPVSEVKAYTDPLTISNAYDNGLHYNLEQFFRRLIKEKSILESSIILYTGDHGQTLIENNETWSHCGDSVNEASVPLFLISGQEWSLDTDYRASHHNIFPTLLDLMGIPEEAKVTSYPLSLLTATAADSTDRYFLGGPPENYTPDLINFDE